MITTAIHKLLRSVAPDASRRLFEDRWLRQHALEFTSALTDRMALDERVDFARAHQHLPSNQKRAEIIALLKELKILRPTRLCEIGADKGGTLALFASVAAPDAEIVSLDISYPDIRATVYQTLATRGQKVRCLEADSHSRNTLERVRQWMNGELFDFLFIDGDHSYAGVKADYEMYGPLVRPGGIVAFHDIVPDFNTRFGTKTSSDVGEVPRFWNELKGQVRGTVDEFIEDPEQDGYGIGVIHVADNT